ncbi:MAG: hypothetical protein KDD69_00860 [Bdellovibrionales bacterium]|nr:hypothetical protein [Bdellovibrionales bacterium]
MKANRQRPRGWSNLVVPFCAMLGATLFAADAWAREVNYNGSEVPVYVTPGEPTQITFPEKIEGGFKRKHSALALERQGNFLVVFAQPEIPYEGEALLVHLGDKRSFALRIMPSDDDNPRDEFIDVKDMREGEYSEEAQETDPYLQPNGFAPPTVVSGLMREMMLVAEFGKRGSIPGYRRSNRYTGETVLHDGTIEAKIEEIFMGTDLWGYVLDVENLLDTTYKINPAAFRLDGTRAVAAENWQLAPRPETAEQQIAGGHKARVYIVTRALRR